MFKKEDQKYNLISYINEDDDLTLREVLLDKLNFSVRYASKLKRFKTVTVNKNFKKLDGRIILDTGEDFHILSPRSREYFGIKNLF